MMGREQGENHIFFIGGHNPRNLGDWLIIKTLLEQLSSFGTVYCHDTGLASYGFENIILEPPGQFHTTLNEKARQCQAHSSGRVFMVLHPGHHFSTVPNPGVLQNRQSDLKWMRACKAMNIQIVRLGASIGPFTEDDRILEAYLGKMMDYYSVRESWSLQYVQSLGIAKARRFCDLSLLADIPEQQEKPRSQCVLSFRECVMGRQAEDRYDFDNLARILKISCQTLQDVGLNQFNIVCQDVTDIDFAHRLSETLEEIIDAPAPDGMLNWETAQALYARTEIAISNRLHVLLISMMLGAVPIALIDVERHTKVYYTFLDLGLQHLVIHVNSASAETIAAQLKEIHANRTMLRHQLQQTLQRERGLGKKRLQELFSP